MFKIGDKVEILLKNGDEFKGIVTKTMAGDCFRVYSNIRDEARDFGYSNYISAKLRDTSLQTYHYTRALNAINRAAINEWKKNGNSPFIKEILQLSDLDNIEKGMD